MENILPDLGPEDSVLCWLPLAHLFQRMINYVAMARGIPMAFSDDSRNVVDAAQTVRPTIFLGVPRFFEKLHQGMENALAKLPRWVQETPAPRGGLAEGIKSVLRRVFVYRRLRKILGGRVKFMVTGSAPTARLCCLFFVKGASPFMKRTA